MLAWVFARATFSERDQGRHLTKVRTQWAIGKIKSQSMPVSNIVPVGLHIMLLGIRTSKLIDYPDLQMSRPVNY